MMPEPNLPNWKANALRFTGFPIPTANIVQTNWWNDLIGQPPETELFQPKIGLKHTEGMCESGKLILELTAQRIDWILTGEDQNSIMPSQNLGDFTTIIKDFSKLINQWLQFPTIPNFIRIAFGGVLTLPVKDKVEGYYEIGKFLPDIRLDPLGSTDFMYQINRPRRTNTGKGNIEINRLSKWGVMSGIGRFITLTPGIPQIQNGIEEFSCRLELDINTPGILPEAIKPDQAIDFFQEFIDLGIEISQRGDVP